AIVSTVSIPVRHPVVRTQGGSLPDQGRLVIGRRSPLKLAQCCKPMHSLDVEAVDAYLDAECERLMYPQHTVHQGRSL
ncbi:MAG TPA: hypothetical protein VD978_36855, partial [Azospirillum sp.]|nr:hypothetical protein [Azospirillum sp.]